MKKKDWYKYGWTLNTKNQYWTEDTERQVEFIIKTLELTGKERILDLACGYGRHSISFASRGFSVTGVDITKEYIEDATNTAKEKGLDATFIHCDLRELKYKDSFDVVLNLADGAIGYLEDDIENDKIFDVISKALKNNGKHFMDICNADHAKQFFPKKSWHIGEKNLTLDQYEWDEKNRRMKYAADNIKYGEVAKKPLVYMKLANSIRLYNLSELNQILKQRNMQIISSFSDYNGSESSAKEKQLLVYSKKLITI